MGNVKPSEGVAVGEEAADTTHLLWPTLSTSDAGTPPEPATLNMPHLDFEWADGTAGNRLTAGPTINADAMHTPKQEGTPPSAAQPAVATGTVGIDAASARTSPPGAAGRKNGRREEETEGATEPRMRAPNGNVHWRRRVVLGVSVIAVTLAAEALSLHAFRSSPATPTAAASALSPTPTSVHTWAHGAGYARPPSFSVSVAGTDVERTETAAVLTFERGLFPSGSSSISEWGRTVLRRQERLDALPEPVRDAPAIVAVDESHHEPPGGRFKRLAHREIRRRLQNSYGDRS